MEQDLRRRQLRITLEYDGSGYCGWQRQEGQPTIQHAVENALERVLGHPCPTITAGRTDTGVHALGQTISLSTSSPLPHRALLVLLNRDLPPDIAVRAVHSAPSTFDARRDALTRHYRFHLLRRNSRTAIAPRLVTVVPPDVDVDAMRQAARIMEGEHDFQAFRSTACQSKRTRLTLNPIGIREMDQGVLLIDVSCRSFLHNMVRILTGALLSHGRGRIGLDEIQRMLDQGQRHHAAVTLAPHGLFLRQVDYPQEIHLQPGATVSFPLDHGSPAHGAIPSCEPI